MSIKNNFLDEVKIGYNIEIMVGNKEIKGKIIRLDIDTVKLLKNDGKEITISIDNICSYEVNPNNIYFENETKLFKENFNIDSEIEKLKYNGISFFNNMEIPICKNINDTTKNMKESSIKTIINGLINSFNYAVNKLHENSLEGYKLSETISKTKSLLKEYPKSKIINNLLGLMYANLKYESLSLQYLNQGNDNITGFAVAHKYNDKNSQLIYSCRHFIYDEELNPYIIKFLLTNMVEENDFSLFMNINNKIKYKQNTLEGLIASLLIIFSYNNIEYNLKNNIIINNETLNELLVLYKNNLTDSKSKFIKLLPKETPDEDITIYNDKKSKKGISYDNVYNNSNLNNTNKKIKNNNKRLNFNINDNSEDYFIIARRAEVNEKDLDKAITLYKKAISKNQRLSSSIPNLVGIYVRLEKIPEALELLETDGIKCMKKLSFLNLKLSVLKKNLNKQYEDEIKNTYKELHKTIDNDKKKSLYSNDSRIIYLLNEKKNDLLLDEAYIMMKFENYKIAQNIYLTWLNNTKDKKVDTKYINQKRITLLFISKIYYQLNDNSNAIKYANKVLEIDKDNEEAKLIIKGEINNNIEPEQEINILEGIGGIQISNFFKKKVNDIDVETTLKNKGSIKDGVYIGNEQDAINIITSIRHRTTATANFLSIGNDFFSLAKIVKQLLERKNLIENRYFNEERYLYFIAVASLAYGNYMLYGSELNSNIDSARYFYIQSFNIFQYFNIENIKENKFLLNPIIIYIESYFYNADIIKKDRNLYKYNVEDMQKVIENSLDNKELFTIGIIEFFINNNTNQFKDKILLYIFQSQHKEEILKILYKLAQNNNKVNTVDEFKNLWNIATKIYINRRNIYSNAITNIIDTPFLIGQLYSNIDKLKQDTFKNYMNETDKAYMEELNDIFKMLIRYNEISEFEYKSDILMRIEEKRKRLEEKVNEFPTYFGYELLLSKLEKLQAKIYSEASTLYGNSEPEIEVILSGESSVDEKGLKVMIPIAFTNKKNVQSADNVSINVYGEGVENIDDNQLKNDLLLGNGIANEKMFTLKVPKNVLAEQVFSVNIEINYKYKKNMSEYEEKTKIYEIPIPLYKKSKFETIDNKFEPHRNGAQVKDKEMFYGRDELIEKIIQQISDNNGNILNNRSLALYGQTRTGKSSLLYHIEQKLRKINPDKNIIINIGSIGEQSLKDSDITDFLYAILDQLNRELKNYHQELNDKLNDNDIQIDADLLLNNAERSQILFNNMFKEFCNYIQMADHKYNIIIFIDEFTYIYDWIRQGKMTDRFMKFWKAFIQNNNVFAIIVGQDHMMKFIKDKRFTNDFGATHLIKVTYLSEKYAKELMYKPIYYINENGEKENRYREEALNRLYELTSGSAFLIMNLCAGLVDYLNEIHSVYITKAHIDDYLKKNLSSFEEPRFFEPQYDDKSNTDSGIIEKNKNILKRIAQESNKKEWASLQNIIKSEEDNNILENLRERDVIIKEEDRCKIKVTLYKEWILEKYGLTI